MAKDERDATKLFVDDADGRQHHGVWAVGRWSFREYSPHNPRFFTGSPSSHLDALLKIQFRKDLHVNLYH